ncbi:MAG: hypothetical protein A3I77_03750 [Gammaproteobacteria bacterium RIFCSPLOWO2_02_FULL_42_14]|nr:MAG: hypothetical protein A3B71_05055 [Gammaproteobacteria bacterium RIFCSPHIGHO2_02_FULL_42_43]OGT28570.1 MAG: hypothetical protein A2624_04160 [Gammaproteobacteria bacterium RIFCSPHIGHO2_01_FULL_42_8]OGT51372.1 MAG: hypothetical protein A3E54_04820 [Gammaproteobacteria bacterium RIFCSPHIGHO2_12_FULL_41_25]OGT62074.1 MAG: hypothetical protein A3I77_03750 [Gammaproteobacteria bacterium RIFCSPLOWO2_02_FULL_42_14]OGT85746.1 MAG: hypothetical protein A3G86_03445 [Gammaproteobacteria bacterium R
MKNFDFIFQHRKKFIFLYLFSLFLIGIAYLCMLPVFEGYDEKAHFSNIRQIADTKKIPIYGKSTIDHMIVSYSGPIAPYFYSKNNDLSQKMTYINFFADKQAMKNYVTIYEKLPLQQYRPSSSINWEAQHPPLYYLLLTPVDKVFEQSGLITTIFFLRLSSYLFALLGITFSLMSFVDDKIEFFAPKIIGFLIYPFIFPEFFSEFARMGNDSLCLFFAGLFVYLYSKWSSNKKNSSLALMGGIVLGLGLLTKAFFLPIMAAFLLFSILGKLSQNKTFTINVKSMCYFFFPALLIGGGWYVYKFLYYGNLIGSDDAIHLAKQGGLFAGLKEHFSIFEVFRSMAVTIVTYIWAGTQSLIRMPHIMQILLLFSTGYFFLNSLLRIIKRPIEDELWIPICLLLVFAGGFFYHVILCIALSGNGDTPGWYLHILLPWTAPMIGVGFSYLWSQIKKRWVIIFLLCYSILFFVISFWFQLTLFAGCSTKGGDKYYHFTAPYYCLGKFVLIVHNLSILTWSAIALPCFIVGVLLLLFLLKVTLVPERLSRKDNLIKLEIA